MKGYVTGLGLSLLFGVAGAASAITATLDLGDPTKSVDATQVTSPADGKTTATSRANINAVSTAGFLYVDVKDDLFKNSKAVWAQVRYFDEGADQMAVQFNGVDVAADGTATDNDARAGNPNPLQKFDTKVWYTQNFKLAAPKLAGKLDGKADFRIDDLGDGAEIIASITFTDEDPDTVRIPKNNPAKPVVIDGKKGEGEWDGAFQFNLGSGWQDAYNGSGWTGRQDYSGVYSFKWDEKGLYILGEVTDDVPFLNDKEGPDNLWQGDGMELYVGLDNTNPSRTHYIAATDFQIMQSLGLASEGGTDPQRALHHGDSGVAVEYLGKIPASDISLVKRDGGYLFEYTLPWTVLNKDVKMVDGQAFSISMFGNDGDDAAAQETAMSPWGRKSMWVDPSSWTSTVLEPIKTVETP
jgi:hypothetical protein